ncbi:MAG: putative lipid II flippase FtsW [Solirubrobacterales bacterium]
MRLSRRQRSRGNKRSGKPDAEATRTSESSVAGSAVAAKPSSEQSLLWTVTIALFAAGAVMVYSASSASSALTTDGDPLGYLKRYLVLGGFGLLLMRYTSRMNLNRLREITPVLLGVAFVLLVLVLVPGFGVEINGAKRWLGAGMARFQPSEVMKLVLVLYAAMLIAQDPTRVRSLKTMSNPLFFVIGAAVLLIALQPDLGTDLVICATMGILLIAAGARLSDLAKVGAVLAVIVIIFSVAEPYRMARITTFINPGHDPTGIGFQSEQARIAIGSGGLVGRGLGESVQKVFYLPEAHTDMILAVIGEELGLLGITGLVMLYLALIVAGLRAAKNSRDAYARLLGIGITSMIACQAILNLFAVLGMAPLTGVPLPFISYGGMNLIVMLGGMGLLVNVASGKHNARVRVIPGGASDEHRRIQARQRERRTATAGAPPLSDRRSRGHYESRNRGRGNGRTRRPGPGSR